MDRYRHPRLVGLDNRGHLAKASVHARDMRMSRVHESGEAAASARIAGAFEEIVRAALARVVTLSDDRILAYEEAKNGPGYERRYRELDAVSVVDGVRIFEIKASRSEKAALRGTSQLRKAGVIVGTGTVGWRRGVALVLVWVDTGGNPVEGPDWLSVTDPTGLSVVVDAVLGAECACLVRIAARQAWAWRGELGVVVEEGVWDDYEAEAEIAQRRRALAEAGVDAEDWPADLRQSEPIGTRWQTGAEAARKDSGMANALRLALKGGGR